MRCDPDASAAWLIRAGTTLAAVGTSAGTTLVAAGLTGIEATFAAGAMFDDTCWIGEIVGTAADPAIIVPVSR